MTTFRSIFDTRRFLFLLKWVVILCLLAALIANVAINRAERNLRVQMAKEQARQGEVQR